ncbi:MAG: hypothetical protein DMG19_12420 [Acidobacteria bacterium]|nr:MAG: hypothetical protein DMG19_12420 [Acidobacteriota bacterium]
MIAASYACTALAKCFDRGRGGAFERDPAIADATEVLSDSTLAFRFGARPFGDLPGERDPFLEANLSAFAFSPIDLRAAADLFGAFFAALGLTFAFIAMRCPEL